MEENNITTEKHKSYPAGIGIPVEVAYNFQLSQTEKILFGYLQNLSKSVNGCWASNEYLGKIIDVGPQSISNSLSALQEYGYIKIELTTSKSGTKRKIFINPELYVLYKPLIEEFYSSFEELDQKPLKEKLYATIKKIIEAYKKNYRKENTLIDNKEYNSSKEEFHSYSDSSNLLSNKSPCGEIKLNRRKQETLSDSNITSIPIKQENIPATLSLQESTSPKNLSKVRQKIAEGQQPIVILPQKKEITISSQMQEVLDYWKSEKLFISKDDTGTHRDGLKKLQDLFNGKLFKRKYTTDEIIGSISRFSTAVKDKDYYPISKKDYQKTNISVFISNPFAQEASYFLKFLDESLPNPIAKQKENLYKTIVSTLESRFDREIKGGMETDETLTKKIEKRNKIIDASVRLYNFCIKNKDRLGYMSQEEMANMLFDAVNDATSGNPKFFNINRLCLSDITWSENLPAFAFSKGYANDMVPQDIRSISDYGYEDQPQPAPQDQDPDDQDIFDEEDAARVELTEEQKTEQRSAQIEQQKAEAAFEERCRNRGAKLKEMPASIPNGFRQRHGMLYDDPEDD